MIVKMPKLVKYSILSIGNRTKQRSALKLYAAIYRRYGRRNSLGYFDLPSEYMKAVYSNYNLIIDKFIEDGIIDFYKRNLPILDNMFESKLTPYYSSTLHICMKYRFLIDIESGEEIEVDMKSGKNEKWYNITKNTLTALGYDKINITRDSFGRRVHHNLTQTYKEELKDRGFSVIDAKCS